MTLWICVVTCWTRCKSTNNGQIIVCSSSYFYNFPFCNFSTSIKTFKRRNLWKSYSKSWSLSRRQLNCRCNWWNRRWQSRMNIVFHFEIWILHFYILWVKYLITDICEIFQCQCRLCIGIFYILNLCVFYIQSKICDFYCLSWMYSFNII